MREIALHLLDIAENSVAAKAHQIALTVCEDLHHDRLTACVTDDGKGMDAEMVAKVVDPFITSRTTRKVGLGIPLFKAAAEACNGSLSIDSTPGHGTCVTTEFQRSHIDRMPLGDLIGTMLTLVIGFPGVHWIFRYRIDDAEFVFDDEPIKKALGEVPLTEPAILTFIKDFLREGIARVQRAAAQTETVR